jgi:GNAT superfamily N-acetyltransferase
MHPDFADPDRREAIFVLFDLTWPGITDRIRLAARMGWDWTQISTPFVHFEGKVAVAHVGVLDLPVLLDGIPLRIAGVHGVCTHPEYRRRGHFRTVMERALAHVDAHWPLAKLNTGQPQLYERFGFARVAQSRYRIERRGGGGAGARALGREDLPWIHERLRTRQPLCSRFATCDAGWLIGIDEVLWKNGLEHFHAVGEHLVAWEIVERGLQIYEVAGPAEPQLDALLAASPWAFEHVQFWTEPGSLVQKVELTGWPKDDVLMVRGEWPLTGPVAISPLTSH